MKNREWITNKCIYDLLCTLNENNVNHCVVTQLDKEPNIRLCRTFNSCKKHPNTEGCNKEKCTPECEEFKPNCEMCIAEYLNKERRNDLCRKLF